MAKRISTLNRRRRAANGVVKKANSKRTQARKMADYITDGWDEDGAREFRGHLKKSKSPVAALNAMASELDTEEYDEYGSPIYSVDHFEEEYGPESKTLGLAYGRLGARKRSASRANLKRQNNKKNPTRNAQNKSKRGYKTIRGAGYTNNDFEEMENQRQEQYNNQMKDLRRWYERNRG